MDTQSEAGVLIMHQFPDLIIEGWTFSMYFSAGKASGQLELTVASSLGGYEAELLDLVHSRETTRARINGLEYGLIYTDREQSYSGSWGLTLTLKFHAVPLRSPKLHPVTIMRRRRGLR